MTVSGWRCHTPSDLMQNMEHKWKRSLLTMGFLCNYSVQISDLIFTAAYFYSGSGVLLCATVNPDKTKTGRIKIFKRFFFGGGGGGFDKCRNTVHCCSEVLCIFMCSYAKSDKQNEESIQHARGTLPPV